MNKRQFLKTNLSLLGALVTAPMLGWAKNWTWAGPVPASPEDPFSLPALDYAFNALEPFIDEKTMMIHHGKHHAAYVKNLNAAIQGTPFAGKTLEEILAMVTDKEPAIRNNGGGHYNHSLFWKILTPKKGTQPSAECTQAITQEFGGMPQLKEKLLNAAKAVFGSGWAWLAVDAKGKLFVSSTPNQDNPLMTNLAALKGTPILGIDVWEHAYYLKYQNLRADYLEAVWNVLNWEEISSRYKSALPKKPGTFDLWPMLGAFHKVMSETFHPMEEGDLQPIKTRSGEMAQRAGEVASSPIPAPFNTPDIAATVKRLKKDSKALDKLVKKQGTDEQIKSSLTALHDVFHSIVGLCRDENH
ncbi:MAG: superoxide dismutase [Haliscomenobacter sp.]|nr:superoxide dismutase [Haliscomenobacter sp.]